LDKDGTIVKVTSELLNKDRFKISKISREVSDEDLQIAFVLLKRAQKIFNKKCSHPYPPEVDFVFKQLGKRRFKSNSGESLDIEKLWKEKYWCE